jgi:hypothetical protein
MSGPEEAGVGYTAGMRVDLDMCCLKRPFDDQSQVRIRLESEAVLALIAAESESLRFVRSAALRLENMRNPIPWRAARVDRWLAESPWGTDAPGLQSRVSELISLGFGNFDALHIASAEAATCDVFASCDRRLLAHAARVGAARSMRFLGVAELAAEVLS